MKDPWSRLERQTLSRELTPDEIALANAIEAIFAAGVSDFGEVARRLTGQRIVAPVSRRVAWDVALLEAELSAANRSLDQAYARNGIGA